MSREAWRRWRVSVGLVALGLVPVAAGAVRVVQLAAPVPVTDENARFFAAPVPVVVHIVSATLFVLVGAFQFPTARWARGRRWHRRAGRVVAPAGVVAALSGLWMSATYPRPVTDDLSLEFVRYAAGGFMLVALVAGTVAVVVGRDVRRHRAWMTRGYAVGLGAGTQVFTHIPYVVLVGTPNGGVRTVLMAAGWLINLAVAEWVIRRRQPWPTRRRATARLRPSAT